MDASPAPGGEILQWLHEGGAFAVVIVVLYFYRRDYAGITDYWKQQNALTADLVKSATAAQVESANALRESSNALKEVVHAVNSLRNLIVWATNRTGETPPPGILPKLTGDAS